MTYRAIVYAWQGIVHADDSAAVEDIERRHGLPVGAIAAAAREPSLYERAMCGYIDDETWRRAVRNALVRAHGETAAGAAAEWAALTGAVDEGLVAVAAEARGRLRTALLAEASTRLETDLQRFGLDKAFDVVVSTARTGFPWADPRLNRVVTVRLGFLPAQCLYVDRDPAGLEAARAHGLTPISYASAAGLRLALAEAALGPTPPPAAG